MFILFKKVFSLGFYCKGMNKNEIDTIGVIHQTVLLVLKGLVGRAFDPRRPNAEKSLSDVDNDSLGLLCIFWKVQK